MRTLALFAVFFASTISSLAALDAGERCRARCVPRRRRRCVRPSVVHDDVSRRKSQHLDLVQREEVEPAGTDPLFRCVRLVHRALPELRLADVDLSAEMSGARLRAPLMVVGMTGGTDRAGQINRDLARIAEEEGIAFGVGSMRVLLDQPELLPTFLPTTVDPDSPTWAHSSSCNAAATRRCGSSS